MTPSIAAALGAMLIVMAPHTASAQGLIQRLIERAQAEQEPPPPRIPEVDGLAPWLKRLHETVPQSALDYATLDTAQLAQAASAVEDWCALWGRVAAGMPSGGQLEVVGRLHEVKQSVDRQLENVLGLRAEFAALPDNETRHEALRRYLQATSTLIDLSGRLRYLLVDVINGVANRLADDRAARNRLLDLLIEQRSGVGAEVMSIDLFDRTSENRDPSTLFSSAEKSKLIELIAAAGSIELIDPLARYALNEATPPTQLLAAAEAIRGLGLPQDPRPNQDKDLPKPPITAAQLRDRLAQVDPVRWSDAERTRVDELLSWLDRRAQNGLEGDTYRIGQFDVRPGDWLLMRNPSPYNLFTDLSPGLFTHVGVVALETGGDGKRRMVIVDLPERGSSMPATNVETFLNRTRHYVFLRHPDAPSARKMAEAAASLIGNPTQFDLNFRTDRVAELKGKPLHGRKVHTYCAGLLLLCAQETGQPRETFFPLTETTAPGNTKPNMAKLGLSLGEGFISPTGALFSPRLEIVGRREPMYDAGREIEEAIYDHFADRMQHKELNPSPNAFQALRLKMAEASKTNPVLATALAASAGVSDQMDLVSAAKAAAVVETLDEIAYGTSGQYVEARLAILQGMQPTGVRLAGGEQVNVEKYRSRHADLAARWDGRQLGPRALRIELVRYYSDLGRRQVDERFFAGQK